MKFDQLSSLALLAAAAILAGCENPMIAYNRNLAVGNYAALDKDVGKLAEDKGGDQLMYALCSGSARRLNGDGQGAIARFDTAEDIMAEQDTTSVFSKATTGTWAMMTNDLAFDFDGGGQDRVFTCLYKAIDFAVAGNIAGARTEFNRADAHQQNWLYERRKDIDSAEERMKKDSADFAKEKKYQRQESEEVTINRAYSTGGFADLIKKQCGYDVQTSGDLDALEGTAAWMNAYQSHVSGVFRWINGDRAEYQLRDAKDCGGSSVTERDYSECAAHSKPDNQVWIWVEDGLCPKREEWRLDLPLYIVPFVGHYTPYLGMALPYLVERDAGGYNWSAQTSSETKSMELLADIDKLVKLEYDVYMRGALKREISRVVIKAGVQIAMAVVEDNVSDSKTKLALMGSRLAFAGWCAINTKADTRSWTALPKRVHAVRVSRPADGHIVIRNSAGVVAEVTLPEGNSMVFVTKPSPVATAVVKVFNK